jgi:hypothetical protein
MDERLVADVVPMLVVHQLEMIDVENRHTKRRGPVRA